MARPKKKEAEATPNNQPPRNIVGFQFVPNLLTINVNELAFILHKINLTINTNMYRDMGDLQKYFAPVFEDPPVENVKQESEGAQAPAASS